MNTITKTLQFLDGKKAAIAAANGLLIAYLAAKAVFGEAEVALFGGLNVIFFGTADYYTPKVLGSRVLGATKK